MRFLTPILFLAAAGWVHWYNAQHVDRALVLPFVSVLDASAANDPQKQGSLTVAVLVALGIILGLWEGMRWMQERSQK